MDKKDWKTSLDLMKELLKTKKESLRRMEKDIVELEYCIECYKKKT